MRVIILPKEGTVTIDGEGFGEIDMSKVLKNEEIQKIKNNEKLRL